MTHPISSDETPTLQYIEDEWNRHFGGAVIDPEGNEVPITADMIQAACAALEQQAITGLHAKTPEH